MIEAKRPPLTPPREGDDRSGKASAKDRSEDASPNPSEGGELHKRRGCWMIEVEKDWKSVFFIIEYVQNIIKAE
jgi:hypothetical protein